MSEIKKILVDDVHVFESKNRKYIVFSWASNIGYGELTIYADEEGRWNADTEHMCNNEDKEFIRMVLNEWVNQMEVR